MHFLFLAAQFEFMTWFPTMIFYFTCVQALQRVQISNGTYCTLCNSAPDVTHMDEQQPGFSGACTAAVCMLRSRVPALGTKNSGDSGSSHGRTYFGGWCHGWCRAEDHRKF